MGWDGVLDPGITSGWGAAQSLLCRPGSPGPQGDVGMVPQPICPPSSHLSGLPGSVRGLVVREGLRGHFPCSPPADRILQNPPSSPPGLWAVQDKVLLSHRQATLGSQCHLVPTGGTATHSWLVRCLRKSQEPQKDLEPFSWGSDVVSQNQVLCRLSACKVF